jgi:hypothetical protein
MSAIERYDGPTQWDILQSQAAALAKSAFVPTNYRNKPDDILAAGLYGHEVGLGITSSLSYINVINGKPTLSAEGMVALARSKGHAINGKVTATAATVTGKRADTGDEMTVEWTIEMAKRAKLDGKDTWKQYPESMLWARAVSQLCRMLFPDVLLGLSYTPEEMADIEILDGRVIDTTTGEIDPPPAANLKKIVSAGPTGTETIYVDQDAPEGERLISKEEGERREMVAKLAGQARELSDDQRVELRAWLDEIQIGSNKKVNDYTLEQLHIVDAYFDNVLGAPF